MRKEVVVQMSDSVELTPIAQLVAVANQYGSRIFFEKDAKKINAKSIMGMMSLVLSSGSKVIIDAEGEDAAEAVAALEKFLTQ